MSNIIDFYYVVQFIVQQIFIYLRDLLFNKYYGQSEASDAESQDQKLGTFSFRQFAMDFLTMTFICALSLLVAVFSSKYSERKARSYKSRDDETLAVDQEEDTLSALDSRQSSKTSFHACGDAGNYQNLSIKQIPIVDYPRKRTTEEMVYCSWLVRRTRSGQIYGKYPL